MWLANLRVEGEAFLDYDDIRLLPYFDASWTQDKANPFTGNKGFLVPGQTVRLGEFELGSAAEIPILRRQNRTFTGGLSLASTRKERSIQNAKVSSSDARGRLDMELDYQLNDRVQLGIVAIHDDFEEGNTSRLSFGLSSFWEFQGQSPRFVLCYRLAT